MPRDGLALVVLIHVVPDVLVVKEAFEGSKTREVKFQKEVDNLSKRLRLAKEEQEALKVDMEGIQQESERTRLKLVETEQIARNLGKSVKEIEGYLKRLELEHNIVQGRCGITCQSLTWTAIGMLYLFVFPYQFFDLNQF